LRDRKGVSARCGFRRRLTDDGIQAAAPMSDVGEATGVPQRARVESRLRTLIGFEDARVATVAPLTDGLSNVTCRVEFTDAPVAAAVLRIQPTRGIFEPYDILWLDHPLSAIRSDSCPPAARKASEK
jgi:hypothetical protein